MGRPGTVLHVASYGGSYPGNFIPSLRALGREIERSGLSQALVFSHHAEGRRWLADLRAAGEEVRVLPASAAGALHGLLAAVREIRPAIIHTHFTAFDGPAWLVQQLASVSGPRPTVLWHVHSPYSLVDRGLRRRARDFLKWRVLGRTTYAAVVSEGGYRAMSNRGMRPDRAACIPNGIDFGRLAVREGDRERVRRALGVAGAGPLCLAFAWHPWVKGADVALEGFRAIGERGQATLVMVGERPLEEVAKRTFPAGLPPWIRLAPPVDEVAGYFAASDVFLSPSRSEGFPYAVAEALAAGRPVVRSDIAGTAWAAELPAAVTFRSEDASDLARAVGEVLSWTPGERSARVDASAEIVRARYGLDAWARNVAAWYGRILAGDSTSTRRAFIAPWGRRRGERSAPASARLTSSSSHGAQSPRSAR